MSGDLQTDDTGVLTDSEQPSDGGFVRVPARVWKTLAWACSHLEPNELKTLVAIVTLIDFGQEVQTLTVEAIAHQAGTTTVSVMRAIRSLRGRGVFNALNVGELIKPEYSPDVLIRFREDTGMVIDDMELSRWVVVRT